MATIFPSSPTFPGQQQPAGEAAVANPEAVASASTSTSSSGWQSSGSIGPFFGVISVLTVLAIISCVVGRIYSRRVAANTPLDTIKQKSCSGWVKRQFGQCTDCIPASVVWGRKVVMSWRKDGKNDDAAAAQPQA
ncbi:uncharacterized protein LOC115661633 [Syzygium oleosum]|uniref:uncharacterized protein LOC115661633 n=1 Tax=Syzygium oleosum TaxID=219896 RepID=UPI0024BAB841|nr:uncharacterized protein LOC115661633 [Syzygium oleosum]